MNRSHLIRISVLAALLSLGLDLGAQDVDATAKAESSTEQPDGDGAPSEADESADTPAVEIPEEHQVTWLHSLKQAKELARTRRAPVLIIAGATWCGPCRLLEKEIEAAIVQRELERWTPLHLDIDRHRDEATQLAVSSIPAFRILSPDGRLVASTEGVMEADELAEWLARQFIGATQNTVTQSKASGRLTAGSVLKILKDFRSREGTVRETAMSRLLAVPEVAAAPVVAEFADGGLAERLAFLDLLTTWEAPVTNLDPWIPTSITPDRLRALEDWVTKKDFAAPDDSNELSATEMIEVSRILRNLPEADTTAATALREQLARMGRRTLPIIRSALEDETDPLGRERLTAARYRVAATPELELAWPGGTERLASSDVDTRARAAAEFSKLAGPEDEPLLLELFSDPTPLVREIALEGLSRVNGTATGALVRMLDDPDPNVRAAVLKQLAESPRESLIPRIATYAKREADPDLVVHAIRFLREIKKPAAVTAMAQLFDHASWRVRAEAADGIARLITKSGMQTCKTDEALGAAFLKLLDDEDDFVVGLAIRTLRYVKTKNPEERLVKVAEERPSVTAIAVAALGESYMSRSGITERITQFAFDPQPAVRSAAAIALIRMSQKDAHVETLIRALQDDDPAVRIAVANEVFTEVMQEITPKLQPQDDEAVKSGVLKSEPKKEPGLLSSVLNILSGEPTVGAEETPAADEESEKNNAIEEASTKRGEFIDTTLQTLRQEKIDGWVVHFEPVLKTMLSAEDANERLAAARTLTLLGDADAWTVLQKSAAQRQSFSAVVAVLPGLLWNEKQTIFDVVAAGTNDERYLLADALADARDPRAPERIWKLLNSPNADADLTSQLVDPLEQSYFSKYQYSLSQAEPHEQSRLQADAKQMAETGGHWQNVAAMSLLTLAEDKTDARQSAQLILDDESRPGNLKADALRVVLCCSEQDVATGMALERLSDENLEIAQAALHYLALGREGVSLLSGAVSIDSGYSMSIGNGGDLAPIVPKPPENLTVELLKRFVDSDTAKTRACTAYFATLLGTSKRINDVVSYWQESQNSAAMRIAYRAIAAANRAEHVPDLKMMYKQMKADKWSASMSDFYWTIRIMTGPEILELRKLIRTEQGADELRRNESSATFF